ncbi:hypothetical protein M3Y99_01205000 [Aphelenchoides fujianensis]|nr:hypothetical protein M3Y99_01205000 [Aphelenchoides fujianensis]
MDWIQRRLVAASSGGRWTSAVVKHVGSSRDSSLERDDSIELLSATDDETVDSNEDCWMEDWEMEEIADERFLANGQWHVGPSTSSLNSAADPASLSFLHNGLLHKAEANAQLPAANLNDPHFAAAVQQHAAFRSLVVGGAPNVHEAAPLGQSSPRRVRRLPHHQSIGAQLNGSPLHHAAPHSASAHSTPHRHKAGRTPTLQQIGRNLIEFARASTPRIHRRMQATNKAEEDANRSTVANAPAPPLYGHQSGAAMVANARRLPFQQQQVASSPAPNGQPAANEPGRVSPAHPAAHHLAAFLDEGMRPSKFDLLLQMDRPSQKEMEKHSWNPDDRSLNIFVKDDDRLTLHRHPVAQSTDCIRGRVGYSRGFHVWQIVWPLRQRGTHAVIGVATKQADLHAPGYSSLVGSSTESYGWDLIRNECLHDAKNTNPWTFPDPNLVGERFSAPEKLYCILDCDEGSLAFATDRHYLGVAFRNLRGQVLYPVVCAVWGHCEITMRYMGSLDPEPRGLMDICRRTIRLQMGPKRINGVDELPLPQPLKDYVLFRQRYRF